MAENLTERPRVEPATVEVPDPPGHLGESAATWRSIVAEWVLGADALPLLRAACECWDSYQAARAELLRDGPRYSRA